MWQKRQYWILLPPLFQQIHFKVLRYSWTCVAFQDGVEIGWLDLMRPHFEKIWGLEIHKLEFCAKMLQEPQKRKVHPIHMFEACSLSLTEELIIVFLYTCLLLLYFCESMPQNPLESKISWLGTRLLFLVHNMLIILLLLQMQSSSLIKVDGFKGQMVPGHKFRGIFIHNPIRPFRVRQEPCEFYITNIILLFRVLIKVVAFHFRQSIYFGKALYFLL